eukprot:CAMPEP_0180151504 /NCGR_PEP_ID=MMETSP0986-20121125/22171_1 /TAXON_ID=697907 /ORGANISM="non described non described, Strain CCMP2293" /LENGTH=84 /DNA_ID=CAMNT_0022098817 /DNA_START=32 /DNA_END=286 /DNA_ORIENTATION=-
MTITTLPEPPFSQAAAKPPWDPVTDPLAGRAESVPGDLAFLFATLPSASAACSSRLRCAKCGGAMRCSSQEQEECVHCAGDKNG